MFSPSKLFVFACPCIMQRSPAGSFLLAFSLFGFRFERGFGHDATQMQRGMEEGGDSDEAFQHLLRDDGSRSSTSSPPRQGGGGDSKGLRKYYLVISNPHAGHGRAKRVLDEVVLPQVARISEAVGTAVKVRMTQGAGDAEAWAGGAWARDEISGVMVLGGDGTVREVIHGIMTGCDAGRGPPRGRCPISVVPVGTDNALCKALGISSAAAAVAALLSGRHVAVDVMRMRPPSDVARFFEANQQVYSTCGIGWGVPGAIAVTAEPLRGNWCLGCCRYGLCGCRSLLLNTPSLRCAVRLAPSKLEAELLEGAGCTASTRGGGVPCAVCVEQEGFHTATQWLDEACRAPNTLGSGLPAERPVQEDTCGANQGPSDAAVADEGEEWVEYEGKFMVVGIVCADSESGVHAHLSDGTIDVQLVRAPTACCCGILDTACSIGCRVIRAALCCTGSASLRKSGGDEYVYRKVTRLQVRPDECVETHPFNVDGEIWRGWRRRPGIPDHAVPHGARGALDITVLPSFLTFIA